jgi:hypothetical protein
MSQWVYTSQYVIPTEDDYSSAFDAELEYGELYILVHFSTELHGIVLN